MKKILLSMVLGLSFVFGGGELQRTDSHSTTTSCSSYEAAESPSWRSFLYDLLTCSACTYVQGEHEFQVEDIESDMDSQGDMCPAQLRRPLQFPPVVQTYHQQANLRLSQFVRGYRVTHNTKDLVQTDLVKNLFGHSSVSSTSAGASVGPSVALSDMGFSDEFENGSINLSRSQSFDSQHSYIKLSNGQIERLPV